MGQKNDRRVSRDPSDLPDYSRDDHVKAAIDALFEEDTGAGYTEIEYTANGTTISAGAPFAKRISTYTDNSKTQLRTQTTFTYPVGPFSPFISQITKEFYLDDGSTIHYRITADVTYNANKTANIINVDTEKLAGP